MINVDIHNDCDGRKVVIQELRNGEWVTRSDVFPCSHVAASAFLDLLVVSTGNAMAGLGPMADIPKLENFRLMPVDEVPESLDAKIDDLSEACDLLNKYRH